MSVNYMNKTMLPRLKSNTITLCGRWESSTAGMLGEFPAFRLYIGTFNVATIIVFDESKYKVIAHVTSILHWRKSQEFDNKRDAIDSAELIGSAFMSDLRMGGDVLKTAKRIVRNAQRFMEKERAANNG